jgi:hypothetical protein
MSFVLSLSSCRPFVELGQFYFDKAPDIHNTYTSLLLTLRYFNTSLPLVIANPHLLFIPTVALCDFRNTHYCCTKYEALPRGFTMDPKCSKRNSSWKNAFRATPKPIEIKSQSQKSSTQSHSITMGTNSLEKKYGRPHKMLSDQGAGGSILLVTRQRDNTTFAVKRFRRRHSIEDESTYIRQIGAEYFCGARMHHTNIIKTLDLFEEHGQFLQVMEYAPYCLFDRVMSRKMSIEEINCAFIQILAGTNHVHRSGFAHRDLKLENVVITENGIMKLIDFGSATFCKQPGARNATGTASPPRLMLHTKIS